MPNYRAIAVRAARRYGIDPNIFLRQIQQESGFQPHVVSRAGARGIAQFMPATARSAGINPDNPAQALNAAARMDAANLRKYGNWRDTLSLYNSGRGWAQGRQIGETRNYVQSILGGASARPVSVGGGGAAIGAGVSGRPAAPAPNLAGVRAGIIQGLIAASTAQSHGQQADYAPVFAGLAQLGKPPPSSYPAAGRTGSMGPSRGGPSLAHFDGKPVAAWIAPILQRAREAGWQGTVSSGYRSFAEQTRIYRSGVRPAAVPGTSNHEFAGYPGGAVDVTDPAGLAAILRRLGISTLRWAGGKDPPHFSHPHGGHY